MYSIYTLTCDTQKLGSLSMYHAGSLPRIRGTNYTSPHGVPIDLLDRLLIISTQVSGWGVEVCGEIGGEVTDTEVCRVCVRGGGRGRGD